MNNFNVKFSTCRVLILNFKFSPDAFAYNIDEELTLVNFSELLTAKLHDITRRKFGVKIKIDPDWSR